MGQVCQGGVGQAPARQAALGAGNLMKQSFFVYYNQIRITGTLFLAEVYRFL